MESASHERWQNNLRYREACSRHGRRVGFGGGLWSQEFRLVDQVNALTPGPWGGTEFEFSALRLDLGYVEGRTIQFESRNAEGRAERLPALAADLSSPAPRMAREN